MEIEFKELTPTSLYVKSEGRLDMDSAGDFGSKIKDYIINHNIAEVTLDFTDITFISSFGLKIVLEIYQTVKEDPGIVRIINANDQIKNSFHMVGFDKFVKVNE